MLVFRSSVLLAGPLDTPRYATVLLFVSFTANATTLLALSSFAERSPQRFGRMPGWPFVCSVLAGVCAMRLAGALDETAGAALLVAGAVLSGVGFGYLWGSWAEAYGTLRPAHAAVLVPVVFALTTAVYLLVALAAAAVPAAVMPAMLALPVLSYLCLVRFRRRDVVPGCAPRATAPPARAGQGDAVAALKSLWLLVVGAAVVSCLFGLMWEVAVYSVDSVDEAHLLPQVVNLVAALVLVAVALLFSKVVNVDFAYRVLVPVLILVFAAMPVFGEGNPVAFNAATTVVYGLFDVAIWYLVASTAYDYAVSGFVVGAVVRSVSIIARLLGVGIGVALMLIPGHPGVVVVGVCLGAIYFLALMLMLYRRHRRATRQVAADAPDRPVGPCASGLPADDGPFKGDDEAALRRACAEVVRVYGLTRREAEVLPYLAYGRSAKVIAEALMVSESTVRTHIRGILEKTDLHSKQKIIDLIAGMR